MDWVGHQNELLAKHGKGPQCFGQLPTRDAHYGVDAMTDEKVEFFGDWYYDNFQHEFSYSGGVLIGTEFIRDTYVHAGLPRAFQFRKLFELSFDNGILKSATDHSETSQAFRLNLDRLDYAPADLVRNWLGNAFSRDYCHKPKNA